MNIQKQRELLQELLVSGKLDSLSVQVIALNIFANSIGYEAVNGDVRKGFFCNPTKTSIVSKSITKFVSLEWMQSKHNFSWATGTKIIKRVSLQYNKRTSKKLTSELYLVEFVNDV